MPRFGTRSTTVLDTLHPALQRVLVEAIKVRDFTLIEGHRGRDQQEEYFRTGKTTLHYPDSLHNEQPSLRTKESNSLVFWGGPGGTGTFPYFSICARMDI